MPKLLLADASPMMHRIVEITFAQEGMEVVTARDGEQAMALIGAERPDIVLVDHALPGRSGYDVAAFVKGRLDLAHIPVLLLSGAFEPVDKVRAAQVGCDGVLVKPFEPQQAIARVRERLDAAKTPASVQAAVLDVVPIEEAPEDLFAALHAALGQRREPEDRVQAPRFAPRDDRRDEASTDESRVPTLDALLGPALAPEGDAVPDAPVTRPDVETPEAAPFSTLDADAASVGPASLERRLAELAERFDTRVALDRGDPDAPGGGHAPGTASPFPPVVTEALIEEVTRRVLDRLTPDAIHPAVSRIVSEIAERLLRDELHRLRAERP